MEVIPQAISIHCFAHILNLVLVDCTKNVACASECFALIESLYVFLYTIKAHPDKAKRELVRLSDTRWACRYISQCVTHMMVTLTEIADSDDAAKPVTAKELLSQVKSFSFIIILVTF